MILLATLPASVVMVEVVGAVVEIVGAALPTWADTVTVTVTSGDG